MVSKREPSETVRDLYVPPTQGLSLLDLGQCGSCSAAALLLVEAPKDVKGLGALEHDLDVAPGASWPLAVPALLMCAHE